MSAASGGGVPVMSKDQLEYIADQHTLSFGRYDGKEDPGFSAWKFAAYYLKKTVRFEWLSNDGCILGLSSFSKGTKIPVYLPDENGMDWLELGPNTILLSKMFEDSFIYPGKPRFTLMHECAHHLLHKGYFQRKAASGSGGAVAYSLQKDEERLFTREKKIWTDEERIEWQANYLASALLIPGKRLDRVLDERGYQEDYFHHVLARSSEPAAYRQLTSRIACAFKVSLTVAEIRLKALKFERLPDLRIPKPDPWACYYGEPKKKRMTKEERQWEKAERSWEKARERELSRKYE